MDLTADKRREMPKSEFAGPGRSFPVNDANHARLAISGATRSEHAGNISTSEEESIKAKARAKLGEGGQDDPAKTHEQHRAAISKMHPEHVHKLVRAAHEGKFGPEAQKMAQSAQQGSGDGQQPPQDGSQPPQDQQEQQRGRTLGSQHIFGRKPAYQPGQNDDDQDDQQPQMGAANIFGR